MPHHLAPLALTALQADATVLRTLARQVAAAAADVPTPASDQWRGSASAAFAEAAAHLGQEITAAAELLAAAEHFVAAAGREA